MAATTTTVTALANANTNTNANQKENATQISNMQIETKSNSTLTNMDPPPARRSDSLTNATTPTGSITPNSSKAGIKDPNGSKIIMKINKAIAEKRVFYSFEYFPPKTDEGVMNLYERWENHFKVVRNGIPSSCFCEAGGREAWFDSNHWEYCHDSIDRMSELEPMFIDVTWGGISVHCISLDCFVSKFEWMSECECLFVCLFMFDWILAGGSTADLTLEISSNAQNYCTPEVLICLTFDH